MVEMHKIRMNYCERYNVDIQKVLDPNLEKAKRAVGYVTEPDGTKREIAYWSNPAELAKAESDFKTCENRAKWSKRLDYAAIAINIIAMVLLFTGNPIPGVICMAASFLIGQLNGRYLKKYEFELPTHERKMGLKFVLVKQIAFFNGRVPDGKKLPVDAIERNPDMSFSPARSGAAINVASLLSPEVDEDQGSDDSPSDPSTELDPQVDNPNSALNRPLGQL